jgi:hypothetical protein
MSRHDGLFVNRMLVLSVYKQTGCSEADLLSNEVLVNLEQASSGDDNSKDRRGMHVACEYGVKMRLQVGG